jgi:hypothetical protein
MHHIIVMRTTLNLDNDIYQTASALAKARNQSLGKIVSALARQSLQPAQLSTNAKGLPVLKAPKGSPSITSQKVRKILEEMD